MTAICRNTFQQVIFSDTMTEREKRFVHIFILLAALVGVVRLIPVAYSYFMTMRSDIELLRDRIVRYEKLPAKYQYWQEQYQKALAEHEKYKKMLFKADTPELISARMQGTLKKLARDSGITVKSMSLPEFLKTDDWLLTTQALSFEGSADSMMQFLGLVKESGYYLPVVKLDVRSRPQGLTGTIKLVGFSRPAMTNDEG